MGDRGEKVIPVKVAVRSRPLLQWELDDGCRDCVDFIHEACQVIVNKNKAFTYDYVFDSNVNQETVYNKTVLPLINGIFKGYNGTVLAYGQTGSGKTYSMGSAHCVSQVECVDDVTGIIPRVVHDIFAGIEERKNYEFLVKVSYVEIYKEDVKDLLSSNTRNQNLVIRENTNGSIRIAGLTEAVVSSVVDTLEYMERGNRNRATGSTAMNATSSRSHAIFTIVLEARCINSPEEITCSKFHLVDLAGSERVKRTKAEGDRFQEGVKINAGLLALGNVISALGDGQQGQHIPYRVSKLTRLLQDSLGGNSLTVMIACISPADSNAEETVNTLRYADRARKIKNKAMVNRDPHTAEIVSLRKEVQQLRLQLLQTNGTVAPVEVAKDTPQTREQLRKLEMENRQLLQEMRKLVDANTEMCEKAVAADVHLEQLESKLLDLKKDANSVTDDPHDLSLLNEALHEESQQQCMEKLRLLRTKILEVELDSNTSSEDAVAQLATMIKADDKNESTEELNVSEADEESAAAKAEHILRTAKLSNQLQELTKALAMKEELAKKMCASDANMGELRKQYEERLKKLDKDLNELQNERDSLAIALKAAQKNKECQKISEKRRLRLVELESQIKGLKQEKREKEKMTKMKAQSDQKIATLNSEIQAMKSNKVKLMRQIKEENAKFLTWKKEKEREVKQLKEKNRKRQFELVKLERDFNNQKNVLRRKTEEAAASNRRLKEALMKQRITAEKRSQTQSRMLDSANSRMKASMEEDIEIAVSAKEAKNHLTSLEEELSSLREQLHDFDVGESPTKRRRTFTVNVVNESQRRELLDECQLKEVQIKELQNKLADAKDARSRQQSRLLQITSIAEARSVMKHLFYLVVDSRLTEEACRKEATALHNQLRAAQTEANRFQKLAEEASSARENEIALTRHEHQKEVLFLTKQLNESMSSNKVSKSASEREEELSSKIHIQANVINQLLKETEILKVGKQQIEKQLQEYEQKQKSKPKKFKAPALDNLEEEAVLECLDDSYVPSESELVSEYDSDYLTPRIFKSRKRRSTMKKQKKLSKELFFCLCAKSKCDTKRCKCRKADVVCNDLCRCAKENCCNIMQSRDIDSTDNSLGSTENSVNNTTYTADPTSEEKENPPFTPYYKRMSTLLNPDESNKSTIPQPTTSTDSKYKPCYFSSPMTERNQLKSENVISGTPNSDFNFPKPTSVVQKKRKLHANEDLMQG